MFGVLWFCLVDVNAVQGNVAYGGNFTKTAARCLAITIAKFLVAAIPYHNHIITIQGRHTHI